VEVAEGACLNAPEAFVQIPALGAAEVSHPVESACFGDASAVLASREEAVFSPLEAAALASLVCCSA